jgi:hypothetical protein
MLENTLREIEYSLDILRATKGEQVEVVWHSEVLILQVVTLLSYTFIFRKQFYFLISGLKIIGHGNPDNNLESPCIYGLGWFYRWKNVSVIWLLILYAFLSYNRPTFWKPVKRLDKLDSQEMGVRLGLWAKNCSLFDSVRTGSGSRAASCPMGMEGDLSPWVRHQDKKPGCLYDTKPEC